MGGMFTVMKVREGLARDDYGDPGPYKHPQGSVAYEVETPAAMPARQQTPATSLPTGKGNKPPSMKGMKM
jgi:hypothetical protein